MPRSAPARPLLVWLSSAFLLTVAVAGCESSSPPPEAQADAAPAEEASEDPASKAPAEPATSETAKPGETETGGDTPPPPADVLPSPAETAATDGEKPQAAPRQLPPGADPLVPEGVTRETTEGWWRIVFSVNGNDYSAGFVRIGKDEGGAFKVEEVRTNDIINPAKPVQTDATAETVHIAFRHEDNEFDYVGALDGNVIRGNLQFEHPRQNLVRLVPVKDSDVTDAALDRQELGTTFGVEPVVTALQSDTPAEELGKIADTWRNSPMLYMAYDVLFAQAKKLGLDRPALERMAEEFEKTGRVWGERAEQAAKLNIATGLLFAGHEIDLGRRKLGEAKAEAPELVEAWGELLAVAERVAAVEEARRQVAEGQVEQGMESLRRLHAEKPADPVAAYRLAVAEREHGSADEALRLFARLAALPQTEAELGDIPGEPQYVSPRRVAATLYEEKHGSRDGFEAYLGEVYREAITSFLTDEDRNRTPTESAKIALVELFTGAMCPPCVAADVATEAVEKTFPGSDVVVLRYHVHHPGPDPLANPDTAARQDYYGDLIEGTPTVLIDGQKVGYNVGGGFGNAANVYGDLAETVAAAAAEPAGAGIDLSAAVEGGVLRIAAKATGVENPPDSLRLRVAVAESRIHYTARNGIREHEMVVREMPGGASGVAPVDGALAFEQEVPLVEMRDRLAASLDEFEGEFTAQIGQPFAFDEKPLDLRRLSVVAFLQDDATRKVLQAAVVPIEQEVELPPLTAERAGEDGTTDAATEAAESAEGPSLAPPE